MSGVVVGALLSKPSMERKVAAALRRGDVVHAFAAWSDLAAFIENSSPDAVVLDPAVESGADWGTRLRGLEKLRPRQVILYTDLTPELAATLIEMGRSGIAEVIFRRLDDYRERIEEALASAGIHGSS